MSRYSAAPVMAGLKDFQRHTVGHIMQRFFGPDPTRRFLVADETGLGKSVVARGVIAKTLERLQDDDDVDRVDVIYVCSNQDIARQNIDRLKVTTGETVTLSSRLTMLATDIGKLSTASTNVGKPINLVAFTPGTSFDRGQRTGKALERALLFLLLQDANDWDGWRSRAAMRALQQGIRNPDRFGNICQWLRTSLNGTTDPAITADFLHRARQEGLISRFEALLDDIGRRHTLPGSLQGVSRHLIGDLRSALAKAGVRALQPDLIILDEFQRFRHLFDPDQGEAAVLAQHLFDYPGARLLLLSATPYKPFTFAEEAATGEDHHADFRQVLRFLTDDECWHADVTEAFETYREAVTRGQPCADTRHRLRELLLQVMCRTERPAVGQYGMLREHITTADEITSGDVGSYVAMRRIAAAVGAPMTVEYWKSAPYFLNFIDGYLLGDKVRAALRDRRAEQLRPLLASAHLLDANAISQQKPIDLGNSRLRQLAADTIGRGWWRLLWVPPSLPYHALGEPFAAVARDGMTKRLLFSSWNATPTAVSGVLSYEAERQLTNPAVTDSDGGQTRRRRARLDYHLDGERPAAMSALALFWPHPDLAAACDPLDVARQAPTELPSLAAVGHNVRERLLRSAPDDYTAADHVGEAHPWQAVFRWPGANIDASVTLNLAVDAMGSSGEERDDGQTGLRQHVSLALDLASQYHPVAKRPDELIDDLAAIGLHGPGNIAWRALGRLLRPTDEVTTAGHWKAAAVLASGLRSLFNRAQSALLLDQLYPEEVYWRSVLKYCADGDLQAVLDEYLHTLRSTASDLPLDNEALLNIANKARAALTTRPSTYAAFNPHHPETPIRLPGRFALRYGGRNGDDAGIQRQVEVRNAFNSPFWPFVVTTTSAGQEGIDFHQWCSAIVHWNTPANPVDFEQREGRVHRFGGHAVRRNIATAHRADALTSTEQDVWKAAYDAARAASEHLGDFAPYWVFPGPAKIERHVLPYPLSKDQAKLDRLKEDLVLYRLAFGQPRQEDMLALLRRNGTSETDTLPDVLNLRPQRLAIE
ncbi:helicase C-terminal domain-containing protein [Micromonospora sp. NPDC004704]